jgi:hypothetical protein
MTWDPPELAPKDPWIASSELRRIREEAPADPALLLDLADIRGVELDRYQNAGF